MGFKASVISRSSSRASSILTSEPPLLPSTADDAQAKERRNSVDAGVLGLACGSPSSSPRSPSDGGPAGKSSELEACFTMVNGILGVGVLGFPFAFRSCGMLAAALLILVCLAAGQLSMRLLLLSSQLSGRRSYEEVAAAALGRTGRQTVSSCIFTLNMGTNAHSLEYKSNSYVDMRIKALGHQDQSSRAYVTET